MIEPGAVLWSMVRVKFVFHLVVVFIKGVVHCIVEFGLSVRYVDRVMNWLVRGGGYVWGELLETAMVVRAYVLGEDW